MRAIVPKEANLVPKNSTSVFKGKIFEVYQWKQKMFDGSYETFEMLKRADTVKIIAIKDDKIVVIEEEQPKSEEFFDIPSGRHDVEAEAELDAAKRELLEETGMRFNSWKLIQIKQPHKKIDWFVYLFLATDFKSQQAQKLDAGEKIKVDLLSYEQTIELAKDPKSRFIPLEILKKAGSLEGLLAFPEYKN